MTVIISVQVTLALIRVLELVDSASLSFVDE
jgi:hypothetical protein